jgi:hypothetical protein
LARRFYRGGLAGPPLPPSLSFLALVSIGKQLGGRTYYYLVESARVAGKPRIVTQQYLGSAEEVAARRSQAGPGELSGTRHRAFGI